MLNFEQDGECVRLMLWTARSAGIAMCRVAAF